MEMAGVQGLKQKGIAAKFVNTPSTLPDSGPTTNWKRQEVEMLRWALGFFIVALIAAVLGFSGIAVAAAGIAKILFYIFLVLFLVSLVWHLLRRT
jgi:uncharacterized membrane protein YtjA (UPF0391 family)